MPSLLYMASNIEAAAVAPTNVVEISYSRDGFVVVKWGETGDKQSQGFRQDDYPPAFRLVTSDGTQPLVKKYSTLLGCNGMKMIIGKDEYTIKVLETPGVAKRPRQTTLRDGKAYGAHHVSLRGGVAKVDAREDF